MKCSLSICKLCNGNVKHHGGRGSTGFELAFDFGRVVFFFFFFYFMSNRLLNSPTILICQCRSAHCHFRNFVLSLSYIKINDLFFYRFVSESSAWGIVGTTMNTLKNAEHPTPTEHHVRVDVPR